MEEILARLKAMEERLRTAKRYNSTGGLHIITPDATVIAWCELLRELIAAYESMKETA